MLRQIAAPAHRRLRRATPAAATARCPVRPLGRSRRSFGMVAQQRRIVERDPRPSRNELRGDVVRQKAGDAGRIAHVVLGERVALAAGLARRRRVARRGQRQIRPAATRTTWATTCFVPRIKRRHRRGAHRLHELIRGRIVGQRRRERLIDLPQAELGAHRHVGELAESAAAQLLADHRHDERVHRIEADLKSFANRLPVAEHGPHHAVWLRAVRRAEKMAQLVDQEFEPLRLAHLPRPFADQDVRVQRAARAGHVRAALDHLILAREADRQLRGERLHIAFEFAERLEEIGHRVVGIPGADGDDLQPHARMLLEHGRSRLDALAEPAFPMLLPGRLFFVDENFHGDRGQRRGRRAAGQRAALRRRLVFAEADLLQVDLAVGRLAEVVGRVRVDLVAS